MASSSPHPTFLPLKRIVRSLLPPPPPSAPGCAEGERRQGDTRLPTCTTERSRQEHQERARLYGPGGYSSAHTHPQSAFIYATVLEGAIRSQVNDGPVTTYKAGESFSELPGDRHRVSANASDTEPAKLLAGVRVGHERDGTDDTIGELRFKVVRPERQTEARPVG